MLVLDAAGTVPVLDAVGCVSVHKPASILRVSPALDVVDASVVSSVRFWSGIVSSVSISCNPNGFNSERSV